MKLNPDCIRDILIYLENNLVFSTELTFQEIGFQTIGAELNYSNAEIVNTLISLDEAGFIETVSDYSSSGLEFLEVYRITYNGYQFLETVRPESVWQKTKSVGSKIGSFSIDLLSQVAANILTSFANGQLGL